MERIAGLYRKERARQPFCGGIFGSFMYFCSKKHIIQSMEMQTITINGRALPAVRPDALSELNQAWQALGFREEQPVIVIVGGAGGMTEEDIARVQVFLEKYLIPFALEKRAVIIDGGTDSGVMAAMGRSRMTSGGGFSLMGVAARDIKGVEGMLEPNHSHFILCPGSNWGDEAEWIPAAASALAASQPSATILINGGKVAWNDATLSIQYGRPVLIAEGSGRTADVIATTSLGRAIDTQALKLLSTGKVFVANFFKDPGHFIGRLQELMKS